MKSENEEIRERYEKEGGPAIRHGLNGDHGMSFKEALVWVSATVIVVMVVIGRLA